MRERVKLEKPLTERSDDISLEKYKLVLVLDICTGVLQWLPMCSHTQLRKLSSLGL